LHKFNIVMKNNIFVLPTKLPKTFDTELFEPIINTNNVYIERIISTGQVSPDDTWYNQDCDEWVLLLQGEARLLLDHAQGEIVSLKAGDYVLLPAHRKHRVIYTSSQPPCIWLAIHAALT